MVGLVVTACSPSGAEVDDDSAEAGATSLVSEGLPIPLPAPEDRLLLFRAKQTLIQECAREAGFDDYVLTIPNEIGPNQFSYSIDELGIMASAPGDSGYARPPQLSAEAEGMRDAETRYLEGLSESESRRLGEVLYGTASTSIEVAVGEVTIPTNGCQAAAEAELFGSNEWAVLDTLRAGVMPDVFAALAASEPYIAVTNEWARCMSDAGYEYRSPTESRNHFALWSDAATEMERAVVSADWTCQQQVGYASIAFGELRNAMQQAIEQRAPELEALMAM